MAVIQPHSLLASLPTHLTEEVFETLIARPGVRLERILSMGQATPEGTWFDQGGMSGFCWSKGARDFASRDKTTWCLWKPGIASGSRRIADTGWNGRIQTRFVSGLRSI